MMYRGLLMRLGSDMNLMAIVEKFLAGVKRPSTVATGRVMFATEAG